MPTLDSFSPPAGGALARVRALSRRMQWLTLGGSVLALAFMALMWFWLSDAELEVALREILQPLAATPVQVTPAHRATGFLVTSGVLALLICALYQAHRMFGAFARGEVFAIGTAIRLRRMALALTALGLATPLTKTLLGLALAGAPGEPYWVVLFTLSDYFLCLLGGLLLAIAWAMVEATRIAEENEGFV